MHVWLKMAVMGRLFILLLMILTAGCAKSSQQVTQELWQDWAHLDGLLQSTYPEVPPLILIHGWNGGEFSWPSPQDLVELETKLQRDVYFFTYRTGILANRYPPLEILEEQLERYLANFVEVDVIAHSMGGLLLRQYLLHHPGHPVHRALFLAVPHYGTDAAVILAGLADVGTTGNLQAEELRPGSTFLWRLNQQHGRELKGIEALNVYAAGSISGSGDMVVDDSSAHLPGAANLQVEGDHHLGQRFHQIEGIIEFLSGNQTEQVQMPERRDIWVRVLNVKKNSYVGFTKSVMRRSSPQGRIHYAGIDICCESASAMRDDSGQTLIIENVQEGELLQLVFRKGGGTSVIDLPALEELEEPVTLIELQLPE